MSLSTRPQYSIQTSQRRAWLEVNQLYNFALKDRINTYKDFEYGLT